MTKKIITSNPKGMNTFYEERSKMSEKEYRREYLGEWVAQCAVTDQDGNHCPNEPTQFIKHNGQEVGLCEKCYEGYKYGSSY